MPPRLAQQSSATPIAAALEGRGCRARGPRRGSCRRGRRCPSCAETLVIGRLPSIQRKNSMRVAAHVQQHAAAGAVDVPEPGRVRAVVLLALLDQEDVAQRALVDQLLGADVLGREAELLGVHQLDAGLAGRRRSSRRPRPACRQSGFSQTTCLPAAAPRRGSLGSADRWAAPSVTMSRSVEVEQLAVVASKWRGNAEPLGEASARAPASARRRPPPRRSARGRTLRRGGGRRSPAPMIPTLTRSPVAMSRLLTAADPKCPRISLFAALWNSLTVRQVLHARERSRLQTRLRSRGRLG